MREGGAKISSNHQKRVREDIRRRRKWHWGLKKAGKGIAPIHKNRMG